MKSNDFLIEGIAEDAHEMHLDHEVQMAREECYHAAESAIALHKLLRHMSEQQGLEGWVSAKITLANDYLKTVREYLEYELMSGHLQSSPADVVNVAEGTITHEDLVPISEGATFGSNYAEQLAQQVFDANPNLSASGRADELLNAGYAIAKQELGKRANGIFNDEDFPSDFVSSYSWLQKQSQGVVEGEVYDLDKEYGAPAPRKTPYRNIGGTSPRQHGDVMDPMDPEARRYRADQERVKKANAEYFAKQKQQGVAEGEGEKQSFKVSYYNPKTRQDKVVKIKAASKDDVLDYCANKGYQKVSVEHSVKEGVNDGRVDSPVSNAITRRMLNQHHGIILQYGPQATADAIDQVADWVDLGPDDEIGSSDVSGWVQQVIRYLKTQAGEGIQEEASNRGMSRAAKGVMKYGKDGMKALAKAGREGASEKKLDAIRDKHDNYNESQDISETSAGSVAGVVNANGMGKKKSQIGSLFGGTYHSEDAPVKKVKKAAK